MTALATVLLLGLASGIASVVLAWAELFAPVRARLSGRAAYLASCPVCLGGWISLALTALQGVPAGRHPLVAWWAVWGAAALVAAGLRTLAESVD